LSPDATFGSVFLWKIRGFYSVGGHFRQAGHMPGPTLANNK
jgi:hypothetical protein